MQVLNDNVLVRVEEKNGPSMRGSLYIPETSEASGQILKGTVTGIGTGRLLENGTRAGMSVKISDVVVFPKFNASKIEQDGVTYYVLPETQILAII